MKEAEKKPTNRLQTLSQAMEKLMERGYTHNFSITSEGVLKADDVDATFEEKDVQINEFFRFEGMTNPADSSILYALETSSGLKGTLVDAYGADGSARVAQFMKSIEENRQGV